MALDPDFVADCAYGPGGILIDEIVSIDKERGHVVAHMPTHDDLPITREQRAHPVFHPRHVSGGLMVHMTGMVAVEINREIVPRAEHATRRVAGGDAVEIVHFVGGG